MTAPGSVGSPIAGATGTATTNQAVTVATRYSATSARTATYAAGSPAAVDATPGRCEVELTAGSNAPPPDESGASAAYHGDPVVVSGTVSRAVGDGSVPVGQLSVPITLTTSSVTSTGATVTRTTTIGLLRASVPGSVGYVATSTPLGTLRVLLPSTDLTAALDRSDVGYGSSVTVTGRLERTGATTTGVAGQTVAVKVTPPGRTPVTVGSTRTAADGSYRLVLPLRVMGTASVVFAGAFGLPADSADLGPVVAGTWSPTVTAAGSPTSLTAGTAVTVSGSVSRTYGGTTEPARGVVARVYFTPAGGTTATLVTSPAVAASGAYAARLFPRVSGTYVVKVLSTTGYAAAQGAPIGVTVR